MIGNVLNTNFDESSSFFSFGLVLYIILLGVIPSILIVKVKFVYPKAKKFLIHISLTLIFLLSLSYAAIVTSGTATLETALFKVPEIVCYKTSWLSYQIGKRLINLKYISLVNLIMDKEVVKELIQENLTTKNLVAELNTLLTDTTAQSQIKNDYTTLKNILTTGHNASEVAAQIIMDELK